MLRYALSGPFHPPCESGGESGSSQKPQTIGAAQNLSLVAGTDTIFVASFLH
jgi:hypothetical protein